MGLIVLFRQDLFYRINVIPIRMPALREKPEDIPSLADHFLEKYTRDLTEQARESGKPEAVIDEIMQRVKDKNHRESED